MTEKICDGVVKIKAGGFCSYIADGSEGTALVCACPREYINELLCEILAPPDYIIFTCSEPLLAGGAGVLTEHFPQSTVVATGAAIRNLKQILNRDVEGRIAHDGTVIELGTLSLEVIVTPDLFWPDTMMLFCPQRSLLFSGRAFSDMTPADDYRHYPEFTAQMLERADGLGAEKILPCMGEFSPIAPPGAKAFDAAVFFCSGTGCTRALALAAAQGLKDADVRSCTVDLADESDEKVREVLYSCDKILIGSPTVNRGLPGEVWRLLSMIDAAASSGREFFAFGSYGWSGEAVTVITSVLKSLRMESLGDPFRAAFNPTDEDLTKIRRIASGFFGER